MRRTKFFLLIVFAWAMIFAPAVTEATPTTVILVRHGQTVYNVQGRLQGFLDIPLSDNGLAQAKLLANSLKDFPIDVFIASPLERAYVTTDLVAKAQGKTIAYTDERLREINYGDFAGLTPEERKVRFPIEDELWKNRPWLVTFPNGENLRDLEFRSRNALEDAVAKYPGKTIFIGTHSRVNMILICSVLGIDVEHFWQIESDNTSVNVLRYENGVWTAVLINSVAHLGKLVM